LRCRAAADALDGPTADRRSHESDVSRQRLAETLGHPLAVQDRSAERGATDRFLALEAMSAKGRLGTAPVQQPGGAQYFREVCRGFGALGRLRGLALEAGTTTIAMKYEMRAGHGLFELKAAEDEQFEPHSPRALLEMDAARLLTGPEWAI